MISRNATFAYKGQDADPKKVGRELGVEYVLEGSVRKVGNRMRLLVQLNEVGKARHIWVGRYDCSLEDILASQDDITRSIVAEIEATLRRQDIRKS